MSRRQRALAGLLLAAHASWVIAGSPDTGLRHDPFVRPDLAAAPASGAQASEIAARAWKPQLRAVVVAGKGSMVNVDGTIVLLGGEVDGFRLVGVEERKAVFTKDGARIEVSIGGEKGNSEGAGSK